MTIEFAEAEPVTVEALAIEIADDAAVTIIESYARKAPGHMRGVWDVSSPDPEETRDETMQQDIQRSVKYLDARGMLVRPLSDSPHLVMILPRGV